MVICVCIFVYADCCKRHKYTAVLSTVSELIFIRAIAHPINKLAIPNHSLCLFPQPSLLVTIADPIRLSRWRTLFGLWKLASIYNNVSVGHREMCLSAHNFICVSAVCFVFFSATISNEIIIEECGLHPSDNLHSFHDIFLFAHSYRLCCVVGLFCCWWCRCCSRLHHPCHHYYTDIKCLFTTNHCTACVMYVFACVCAVHFE